nr:MAG TPA: hypothetical protein [Caudoviricetes sp.]
MCSICFKWLFTPHIPQKRPKTDIFSTVCLFVPSS